jgi:hypothetical protein
MVKFILWFHYGLNFNFGITHHIHFRCYRRDLIEVLIMFELFIMQFFFVAAEVRFDVLVDI